MTNEERWELFITELKAYIEKHHHCPNKHCTLYNAQKYHRRKMKEGTLPLDKAMALEEILNLRDLSEHTGGRRKASLRSFDRLRTGLIRYRYDNDDGFC